MHKFGGGAIMTGADVDKSFFDWGTIQILCEARVAGALHLVVAYIPAGSEQALYPSPDVTIIPAEQG